MSKTKQELINENEELWYTKSRALNTLSEELISLQLTNDYPDNDKRRTDNIRAIENTLLYFLQLNATDYLNSIDSVNRPSEFKTLFVFHTGYELINRTELENKSSLLSLFNSYLEYEKHINEMEYLSEDEIKSLEMNIEGIKKHFIHIHNENLDSDYLPQDLKKLYDSYVKSAIDENWDGKEFLKHNFLRMRDNNERWEKIFHQLSDDYNKAKDLFDKVDKDIDPDINEIKKLDLLTNKINENFERIRNSKLRENNLDKLFSGDVNGLYRDYLEYVKSDKGPITEFLKKKIELAKHNKARLVKTREDLESDFQTLENFYQERAEDRLPTKNEYNLIFDAVQRINKNFEIIKNSNLYRKNYKEKLSDRVNYKYAQYLEHKENQIEFLKKDIFAAADRQKKCLGMFEQLNTDFNISKYLTRKLQKGEKLTQEEIDQLDSVIDRINKNCERIRSSGLKIDQLLDGLSVDAKTLYEDYEKHFNEQKSNVSWKEYFYSYIKTPEITKDKRFLNDFVERARNNSKMLKTEDLENIKYALSSDLKRFNELKLELENAITNPFESEKHVKSLNILVKRLNDNLVIFKTQVNEKDQKRILKEIPNLESLYVNHENSKNYLDGNNPTILSFIPKELMDEYRRNNSVAKDSEYITKIVQNLNINMNRLSDLKSQKAETEPGSEYNNLGKIILKDLALLSNIMIVDQGKTISYLDHIKEGHDKRISNPELIKQAQNYQKTNANKDIKAGLIAEKTKNTLMEKQDTNQQKEQTMSKSKLTEQDYKDLMKLFEVSKKAMAKAIFSGEEGLFVYLINTLNNEMNIALVEKKSKSFEFEANISKKIEALQKYFPEIFDDEFRKHATEELSIAHAKAAKAAELRGFADTKIKVKKDQKAAKAAKAAEKLEATKALEKKILDDRIEEYEEYAKNPPKIPSKKEVAAAKRDEEAKNRATERATERAQIEKQKGLGKIAAEAAAKTVIQKEEYEKKLEKLKVKPELTLALADKKNIDIEVIKSVMNKVTKKTDVSEKEAIYNAKYVVSEVVKRGATKFLPEILDAIDIKNLSINARKELSRAYPNNSPVHSLIESDYLKREIIDQASNLSKVIKQSPEKYIDSKEKNIRSFKDGREKEIKDELIKLVEFYEKVKSDFKLNVIQAASEEIKSILDYVSTKGDIDVVKMIIQHTPTELLTDKVRVSAINSALETGKHDVALHIAKILGEQDLIKHKDASMDTRKLCVIYGAEVKDLTTKNGLLPAQIKELKSFKHECDRNREHLSRAHLLETMTVYDKVLKLIADPEADKKIQESVSKAIKQLEAEGHKLIVKDLKKKSNYEIIEIFRDYLSYKSKDEKTKEIITPLFDQLKDMSFKRIDILNNSSLSDNILKQLEEGKEKSILGKDGIQTIIDTIKENSEKFKAKPQSFIGKIFDAVVKFCTNRKSAPHLNKTAISKASAADREAYVEEESKKQGKASIKSENTIKLEASKKAKDSEEVKNSKKAKASEKEQKVDLTLSEEDQLKQLVEIMSTGNKNNGKSETQTDSTKKLEASKREERMKKAKEHLKDAQQEVTKLLGAGIKFKEADDQEKKQPNTTPTPGNPGDKKPNNKTK